jgi:GNAT superfamily N-acetyltransferase
MNLKMDTLRPTGAGEEEAPTGEVVAELRTQLDRMDQPGPWTRACLRAIRRHPEVPSQVLAAGLRADVAELKPRIRRLNALGLTESVERGYRLSPRGRAMLETAPERELLALAEVPETVPALAHHFVETWAPYYGPNGPGDAEDDLAAAAQTDALPVGIVAFCHGALAGTAALRASSVPSHTHLTPWITGLLVLPAYTGSGVADTLLRDVEGRARSLGWRELHVATEIDSERMRSRGWVTMDDAPTLRGPVPILRLPLSG